MNAADLFAPLVAGRPLDWRGLPPTAAAELDAVLGAPASLEEGLLGYYPAERRSYRTGEAEILAWMRDGACVMVEVPVDLPAAALDGLEAPCAVLPQEIEVEGGYAHELVYCGRGLVATVVEPFVKGKGEQVVRLRGIAPIASRDGFGPDLYRSLEDQTRLTGGSAAVQAGGTGRR